MPIILRCSNCKKEEENNSSALKGTDWLVKGQIGGTLVLCPDCRFQEDQKESDKDIRRLAIDSRVEEYRKKLEKQITLKKIRKDREKFATSLENSLRAFSTLPRKTKKK